MAADVNNGTVNTDSNPIEKLKQTGRLIIFPQDTVILREGEVNLDMYKIIKGHAELYSGYGTDQEVLLGIIGPQNCFGEFGLLLHKPAIYTVVSFSEIYALRITEGQMGDFVRENHKSIIDIMRNMSQTMMIMQQQIDLLAEELKTGQKPTDEEIRSIQRNIRGYYNPGAFKDTPGKMHFMNRKS